MKENQEYEPLDDEQCTGLTEEFYHLHLLGNECACKAVRALQFGTSK